MDGLVIVPVTLREANDFVQNFHRHNGRTSRDGGKFAVGIEFFEEMVGVAIVGNPLSATLMDGFTCEVLRCCTNDKAPKGACSKLYGACWRAWREMGGRKVTNLWDTGLDISDPEVKRAISLIVLGILDFMEERQPV